MMIKDLHINKATDTNRRYDWLTAKINDSLDEPIILVGETFYDKDISIQSVIRFTEFIAKIDKTIYIQDIDALSNEILNADNPSIYKQLEKEGISLFLRLSELSFIDEGEEQYTFHAQEDNVQASDSLTDDALRESVRNELEFHNDDLIGIYLSEILESDESPEKKKRLMDIGLDAMKRRG